MIFIDLSEEILNKHKEIASDEGQLKQDLVGLQNNLTIQGNDIGIDIVSYVIQRLECIVSCSFEELKALQEEYLKLIYSFDSRFHLNTNKNHIEIQKFIDTNKEIYNIFIKAYNNFTKRSNEDWNSYIFLKKLGQNVCPYCNANFIHTVQSRHVLTTAHSRAMADLDHFLPKSIFPIFAISISNLVPCCIYCNQRFKSAYYTSFSRNFSPYDSNIMNKISFKINYNSTGENVFDKMIELGENNLSIIEKYYINLISTTEFESFKNFIDKVSDSEIYTNINKVIRELYSTRNSGEENHKADIRFFITQILKYVKLLKELRDSDFVKIFNQIDILISNIKDIYNPYTLRRDSYNKSSGCKRCHQRNITKFKKIVESHLKHLESLSIYNTSNNINLKNSIDFVDAALGLNDTYSIEIIAKTENMNEKYRIYNNMALFQIETVYNEYKGYINQKIQQGNILNDLYKFQMKNQFPQLFQEYSIDNLTDMILLNPQNQKNEILGKLIHDIILPAVKNENLMKI